MGASLSAARSRVARPDPSATALARLCNNDAPHAQRTAARSRADGPPGASEPSPYVELDRATWASLAEEIENPLTAGRDRAGCAASATALDLDEVRQVYLPLSRLLSLHVEAAGRLHRKQEEFLHRPQPPRTPFVIGVAGSVAVGKSTTARVLQQMLAHWPAHPNVVAGHHRRLPAAQRRARAPRPDAPQGLPRVLRPHARCCAS